MTKRAAIAVFRSVAPKGFILLSVVLSVSTLRAQATFQPSIPKTWDDAELATWATPVAGLNVRPTHMSEKEYYALRVENLRTYPVYAVGREPEGYWKKLHEVGPQPLIEPERLKTEADWVEAGRRVFEEADFIQLRTLDPKFIAEVRGPSQTPARIFPDGSLSGMRWVPTKQGVALTFTNCSFCHTRYMADGTRIVGAPFMTIAPRPPETFRVWPLISRLQRRRAYW
jgi:hypothetical protein